MDRTYKVKGLAVDVRYLSLGPIDNNVYIISDDQATMLVDPSCDAQSILEALDGATVDAILITHRHHDHIGAAAQLRKATKAPVIASAIDAPGIEDPQPVDFPDEVVDPCKVDQTVVEGDVVRVGGMEWKVMETPGHTEGSISLFLEPKFGNHPQGLPVLISGDTLFEGTTGRTDFEGGSMSDMRASLRKLAELPDDTVVLPGHNGLTSIADERIRTLARLGG